VPVEALRNCRDQFGDILKSINVKRLVREMGIADKAFHFRHFKGYREIGRGRVNKIAGKEIFNEGEGHELFANLIIVHWNDKHTNLYREMVAHVKTINEDVEAIEQIEDDKAGAIVNDLLKRHTRIAILLCVRLNGVRFREGYVQWCLIEGNDGPAPAQDAPSSAAGQDSLDDNAPASSTGDTAADAPDDDDADDAETPGDTA
jgi:hypothetical protein